MPGSRHESPARPVITKVYNAGADAGATRCRVMIRSESLFRYRYRLVSLRSDALLMPGYVVQTVKFTAPFG